MCGISAVFNKVGIESEYLLKANQIIAHRGPDDEGFLLWNDAENLQSFAGADTAAASNSFFNYPLLPVNARNWKVGLGHRRLAILDLSPAGHQPMLSDDGSMAITFNGEVYNYIEIREELIQLGHRFNTSSDTEVILHAWQQWGKAALNRFNGMFAFVLLDTARQMLYAVRDRFGVKPLYYTDTSDYLAFASEVKQLRVLPAYQFNLSKQTAYDYLRYGLLDHAAETFEVGVRQLMPGHLLALDLQQGSHRLERWYEFKPRKWKGSLQDAQLAFYDLLKDSVKLRMRSDVPVGSALSGGLDSSTIVCLMRSVLHDQGAGTHPIKTITSCYEDKKYDEWEYANTVIKAVDADAHRVFPSFEKLQQVFDKLLWHMDYPFGSTSQFSQWCVFEGARQQGLTVMIDGQGADEQLAGYGGNDLSLYAGLLGKAKLSSLYNEAAAYKKKHHQWPKGFLLGAFQSNFPRLAGVLPRKLQPLTLAAQGYEWIKNEIYKENSFVAQSLQQNLIHQLLTAPLPALLRYEDRNSMAFSVESRVPFMDYRLIEFTLGLPEEMIYRQGERKYILRKSFRGKVPDKILDRTDKMGFVSPEETWFKTEGKEWFAQHAEESIDKISAFVHAAPTAEMIRRLLQGGQQFNSDPWRIICFGNWLTRF